MRKALLPLLLCTFLLVCICFSASAAVSYSDRARYYLYITTRDTEMYAAQTNTDDQGNTSLTLVSIGTLPGSTPVSSGDVIQENYRQVTYLGQDGATHSVVIDKSVIASNYVTLEIGGTSVRVPKAASVNASFVSDYLSYRGISATSEQIQAALNGYSSTITPAPTTDSDYYQENDDLNGIELPDDETPTPTPQPAEATATPAPQATQKAASATKSASTKATTAPKVTATPKPTATPTPDIKIYWRQEDHALLPVELKTLGIGTSIIHYQGEDLRVLTSSLTWNTNADAEHRIGLIWAPKGGNANLRKEDNKSSKILTKATGGRLVLVHDVSDTMTGVYYEGMNGYLLNSVLKYYAPYDAYQPAVLTVDGSETSTKRIYLYTSASESSRRLQTLSAGMRVDVVGETRSFTEIDVDGWQGFVYTKFITLLDTDDTLVLSLETQEDLDEVLTETDEIDEAVPEAEEDDAEGEEESESEENQDDFSQEEDEFDFPEDEETDIDFSTSPAVESGEVKPFYVDGYEMHRDPYN